MTKNEKSVIDAALAQWAKAVKHFKGDESALMTYYRTGLKTPGTWRYTQAVQRLAAERAKMVSVLGAPGAKKRCIGRA